MWIISYISQQDYVISLKLDFLLSNKFGLNNLGREFCDLDIEQVLSDLIIEPNKLFYN